MSGALQQPALYPDHYAWYVLVSALDVMVTWVVLTLGGAEVNAVALAALRAGGVWGLLALKTASIVVVVLICEYVGRARPGTGLSVARLAVMVSSLPVVAGLLQLAVWNGH